MCGRDATHACRAPPPAAGPPRTLNRTPRRAARAPRVPGEGRPPTCTRTGTQTTHDRVQLYTCGDSRYARDHHGAQYSTGVRAPGLRPHHVDTLSPTRRRSSASSTSPPPPLHHPTRTCSQMTDSHVAAHVQQLTTQMSDGQSSRNPNLPYLARMVYARTEAGHLGA